MNKRPHKTEKAVISSAAVILALSVLSGCSGLRLPGSSDKASSLSPAAAESAENAAASREMTSSESGERITWSLAPTASPDGEKNTQATGTGTESTEPDILTVADGSLSEGEKPAETAAWEGDLPAGNYLVGTDIPAGTYRFTVVSGSGSADFRTGTDGGEPVSFGTGENETKEYEDAKLLRGGYVHIHGSLVLHGSVGDADASFSAPAENTEGAFDLAAGTYMAGSDFAAGIYIIDAIGAPGNVSSDTEGDGGITEKLGVSGGDADTAAEFRNAYFADGAELVLGTSVRMTPVTR